MYRVHVGVVGAGQHQLASGVDDLGVRANVGFHLRAGAAVDDPAVPDGHRLYVVEILVNRGDFAVFQNQIRLYHFDDLLVFGDCTESGSGPSFHIFTLPHLPQSRL